MMLITLDVLCNRCTTLSTTDINVFINYLNQYFFHLWKFNEMKEVQSKKINFPFELHTTWSRYKIFPFLWHAEIFISFEKQEKVFSSETFRFMLIKKLLIECDVIFFGDAAWGRRRNFDKFCLISNSNLFPQIKKAFTIKAIKLLKRKQKSFP